MQKKDYSKIKGYYPYYNSVVIGGHTIALKDCKEQIGHDDSIPYAARLFIDNKLVCTIYNDGWGGETNITQLVNAELLEKVNKDIKGLPFVIYPWDENTYPDIKIDSVLDVADCIAEVCLNIKDAFKRKIMKRTIIAINKAEMRSATLPKRENAKTLSLRELVTCEHQCNNYIKQGFYILNCPQFYN